MLCHHNIASLCRPLLRHAGMYPGAAVPSLCIRRPVGSDRMALTLASLSG